MESANELLYYLQCIALWCIALRGSVLSKCASRFDAKLLDRQGDILAALF